jgi:hypothetical protein
MPLLGMFEVPTPEEHGFKLHESVLQKDAGQAKPCLQSRFHMPFERKMKKRERERERESVTFTTVGLY